MRYLLLIGGGFLAFGLFWVATGYQYGNSFGGETLMIFGGFMSIMGLILLGIFFINRNKATTKLGSSTADH